MEKSSFEDYLDELRTASKIIINQRFPQPKFSIGQEVYTLASCTKKRGNTVFVIVEIHIACLSVIEEIGFLQSKEAFTYMVISKASIGRKCTLSSVREGFIEPAYRS